MTRFAVPALLALTALAACADPHGSPYGGYGPGRPVVAAPAYGARDWRADERREERRAERREARRERAEDRYDRRW